MTPIRPISRFTGRNIIRIEWKGLPSNGVGVGESFAPLAAAQAVVTGTFDEAVVTLEGSHDGNVWFPLPDVRFIKPWSRELPYCPVSVRPRVEGGGQYTKVDVSITAIGGNK